MVVNHHVFYLYLDLAYCIAIYSYIDISETDDSQAYITITCTIQYS